MTISLYDSLLERMEGHPYSHYFSTFCPFDSHKTPALLVFDDGLAKCLSCEKVWTHQQLDRKIGSHFMPHHIDTVSVVLPQWRRWEQKYGDLNGIAQAAHRNLVRNPNYQTYLRRRKIYEYVEDGCLGYLDGWITFPVMDVQLSIIDIVVRSIQRDTDVRYVVHPGGDIRPLYVPSWGKVTKSETVYVVYGIIDAISLHLAGLPVVTGVTGKSLSPDLLKPLRKRFLIVPDAGEELAATRLANSLGWRARVKKISWPEGTKDCDDIRRTFGNDSLIQALA